MVIFLYSLIILPIVGYVVLSARECISAVFGIFSLRKRIAPQASWEISHTLLVYAFTVFMISHSALLPQLAADIFPSLIIFSVGFVARGLVYLRHYSDDSNKKYENAFFWKALFFVGHFINSIAIISLLSAIIPKIIATHFPPATESIEVAAIGLVIACVLSAVPFLIKK